MTRSPISVITKLGETCPRNLTGSSESNHSLLYLYASLAFDVQIKLFLLLAALTLYHN